MRVTSLKKLQFISNRIRKDLMIMLEEAGSGHSAGPLGMADVFTSLYFNILNHDPKRPWSANRDRLILSNGHICPVWYATLARAGYFPVKELLTLRKLGSRLQGHPHKRSAPGVENTAGPLGQGAGVAAGIAYAAKMDKDKFHVFCGLGDGEMNEGQIWETLMFAGANKLDNLIYFIDRNYIQIDGYTTKVLKLDPLNDKLKAFGLKVFEINAHNINQITNTFKKAKAYKGKPVAIICNTIPGKGVSFMEKKYEWHGKPPNGEQMKMALADLAKHEKKLKYKPKDKRLIEKLKAEVEL